MNKYQAFIDGKMKIAYMAFVRFPTEKAHGIQITKTCESLLNIGAKVELFVPKRVRNIMENPYKFYGISLHFPIQYLHTINIALATRLGFYISGLFFGMAFFLKLLRNRKKYIFYSVDLDPLSFLGLIILKRPYFFEIHGPKKNSFFNRILFKNSAGIIAVSQGVKKELLDNFSFLKNRIIVLPNGVDVYNNSAISVSEACEKLNISKNAHLLVYTGSFQDWKGIETIVRAAHKLSDITFYLVGGDRKELSGIEKNIPKNVFVMGKRKFTEMSLWRAAADVLLVTGTKKDVYSFYHTSPMKLFEYMASGKPIIASRTYAIESIVSEEHVFFHEPDNVDELVKIIKYVLQNPEIGNRKANEALSLSREYSWDNRAKKILEFINDIVDKSK